MVISDIICQSVSFILTIISCHCQKKEKRMLQILSNWLFGNHVLHQGLLQMLLFWHPETKQFVNFNVSFPPKMGFAKA